MANRANSLARECLLTALDESGQPRKAFAVDIGISDPELSKVLGGTNGARFDLGWLDDVPPVVVLAWIQRYASRKFGARVLLPQPEELLARVLSQVDRLTAEVRQLHVLEEMRAKPGVRDVA